MSALRARTINCLGAGSFARQLLKRLRPVCDAAGATPHILCMGCFDFNLATADQPTGFDRGGVIDVSPSPDEIRMAVGNLNSDDIAERNRPFWERPASRTTTRVVAALQRAGLSDCQTMWVQGMRTGHGIPARENLQQLKVQVPGGITTVVSTLPEDPDKRERLREGHDLFVNLKDQGDIETTILLDNASPFARAFNLDVQDDFETTALASLLAAQAHFPKNRSFAEVGRALGEFGAFVGMAFASRGLVMGVESLTWRAARWFNPGLPHRGYGDSNPSHTILQMREATRQALADPHAMAIEETIDERKPFFLLYTVPFSPQNRIWLPISSEMRRWLANDYPTAIPLFASGNGAADPRFSEPYRVQVSALFPMPDVPAPIAAILKSPSLARRVPRAPSSNSDGRRNGHTTTEKTALRTAVRTRQAPPAAD